MEKFKTYLHIDSTYRDRKQWPKSGDFDIPVSTGNTLMNGSTSSDSVSDSAPIISWSSNRFDSNGAGSATLTGVVETSGATVAASLNDNLTFIVDVTNGETQQQLENYYKGAIIKNTTINEQKRIVHSKFLGIVGTNQLLQITVNSPFGSSFADGDSISITDPTQITIPTYPVFFVPAGRDGENAYATKILYNETRNEYRTITGYDSVSHLLTVDATNAISSWNIQDNYSIRTKKPYVFGPIITATTTTIVIPNGSSQNDSYIGDFIRIPATTAERYSYGNLTAPINEIRRVISYNGSTQTATVTPAFSVIPTTLTTPNLELLPFTRDNVSTLVYKQRGQSVLIAEKFEVELINLILPNDTLNVDHGSTISSFPFVWVELSNTTSSEGVIDRLIHSNNPNSHKMKFFVPVDDVTRPEVSSFINLDNKCMKQVITMKPHETLHFSVRLPNGQIFEPMKQETTEPNEPNRLIQINALFSLKRV
jgi:hypothetical protein